MRHITISTTGIFNAIRPPLFPPIEGKETTTFLLGLDFHAGEISPCLLYTSPSPRDPKTSRMPSSA